MKKGRVLLILFLLLAVSIGVFFLTWSRRTMAARQGSAQGAENDEPKPVAQVQTVPIERKSISEKLTTYGSVVAQPGKTHFVAVSFESRVQHILVSSGQPVKKGDTLLEIQGSPASLLQLHEAESAAFEAHQELEQGPNASISDSPRIRSSAKLEGG